MVSPLDQRKSLLDSVAAGHGVVLYRPVPPDGSGSRLAAHGPAGLYPFVIARVGTCFRKRICTSGGRRRFQKGGGEDAWPNRSGRWITFEGPPRRHVDFLTSRSSLARSGNDQGRVAMAMTLEEAIDFASVHADTDPYGIECYATISMHDDAGLVTPSGSRR
jgi:hypothetical protein